MQLQKEHPQRIFGLDIFRSLAIIIVVSAHGSYLLKGTLLEGFPYIKMIDGVDLFFVLSGFLIGNILLKEISTAAPFGFVELTRFWKRRWFRTLPNYYLILAANVLLVCTGVIKENFDAFNWKFLFFLQNFYAPFAGFFWESWSLSVEEWFYIFTPVLLLIGIKFLKPSTAFLSVTVLMIVFPFIYRMCSWNTAIDDFWYDVTFRKVVVMRLDSIAFGLFAAWFYTRRPVSWSKYKWGCLLSGVILIAVLLNYHSSNQTFYRQVVYFIITPVAAMLLLPFAHSIPSFDHFIGRVVTHISKISYSMYLINLSLVSEVIRDQFPPQNETDGILKYFLFWTIVILVSTLLYKFYEKPIMDLRDKRK